MMPKVIGNDSLIARVNEVQRCMYRQSNELGRLNKAVRRYKGENAKLRDMCSELYRRYWDVEGDLFIDPDMDELEGRLRELGIETLETWQ